MNDLYIFFVGRISEKFAFSKEKNNEKVLIFNKKTRTSKVKKGVFAKKRFSKKRLANSAQGGYLPF